MDNRSQLVGEIGRESNRRKQKEEDNNDETRCFGQRHLMTYHNPTNWGHCWTIIPMASLNPIRCDHHHHHRHHRHAIAAHYILVIKKSIGISTRISVTTTDF